MVEIVMASAADQAAQRWATASILLVDPLRSERRALSDYLRLQGLAVIEAEHVEEVWNETDGVDVVVVVASLPDPGVSAFIRRSAEAGGPPMLVMSETGECVERVLALELGADDLVSREINPRELLARLRGLMRRRRCYSAASGGRELSGPSWMLQADRRTLLTPNGRRIDLSRASLALLTAFAEGADLEYLGADLPSGSLRTAISRLRRRVFSHAQVDLPIRNVRGRGYRFEAPISKA